MKYLYVLLVLAICDTFFSSERVIAQPVFEKGTPHRNSDNFSFSQKRTAWDLENVGSSKQINSIISFLSLPEQASYFVLERSLLIAKISISPNTVFGPWEVPGQDKCVNQSRCNEPWENGRWNADELLEDEIKESYSPLMTSWRAATEVSSVDFMGCMQHTPLRSGDIDGDGVKELILLLPHLYSVDLLVFSTQLNKTIFATKLDFNDIIKNDQIPSGDIADGVGDGKKYQYWSRFEAEKNDPWAHTPGLKSFGKLFFGQFDGDNAWDILLWRKQYKSRLLSDTTNGFELKSELFGHYELVEGEYKLQPTTGSVIEGWLASSRLTWQKGYPSISECPGQEGQLIPEMHDPLLNDPEVLQ